MHRLALPVLAAALACTPNVKEGALQAGTAEVALDVPLGTPMGGYTSRIVGFGRADGRTSPFAERFATSAGVHTTPTAKAIWLHNDDHHLVLVKVDLCYLADHVVEDVEAAIAERIDEDVRGQVMIAASHTHQGWGAWNAHLPYFLGGDQHHPQVDRRLVQSITDAAVQAWEAREEAAIGMGWARDWDPEDRVYRDRRGDNNDLAFFGEAGEATGKDPYLHLTRIERLDGSPLAMTVTFGIHGIAVGADSPMVSTEASGQVERALEAQFDQPVMVMHLQGSGGDASPAGQGARFEKLEDIGRHAVPPIMDLWDRIQVSTAELSIETSAGVEPQGLDAITITRDGTVDFRYAPGVEPDGEVYADDGSLLSPFDEFIAAQGAPFCGGEPSLFPSFGASYPAPYDTCSWADGPAGLIENNFPAAQGLTAVPFPATTTARTAAVRLGPLPVRDVDGTVHTEAISAGFFPGEPVAMFGEQFRRRAQDTWGDRRAWMIGYAQDHEGYLLTPEDWLTGGYEPSINVWGPLQGEYLMERVLDRGALELGDGKHQRWQPEAPAPLAIDRARAVQAIPEATPLAGTRLDAAPTQVPLWTPDDLPVDLTPPDPVRRAQGFVQLAWQGGDPQVDRPVVTLERLEGQDWVPVTLPSGRPLTDWQGDILVTWTPDPLDAQDGPRAHRWWAVWQPVSHWHEPLGLPLGTYRLVAQGQHATGSETTAPWTTSAYQVVSEPVQVVPAALSVQPVDGGVEIWLQGPEHGYRQLAQGGRADGENPISEDVEIRIDGVSVAATAVERRGARLFLGVDTTRADGVEIEDPYGNLGQWAP